MARPFIVDEKVNSLASSLCLANESGTDIKKSLSVLLASEAGLNVETIAKVLRIDKRTVFRYRDELKSDAHGLRSQAETSWGGRRNSYLTEKQEKQFLSEWEQSALSGNIVSMDAIHAALIEYLGHDVSPSTTYRMLLRHNWRKIKPDTRHPKSDTAMQEEFKKNSKAMWMPPSKGTKKTNLTG
jgi:transposase